MVENHITGDVSAAVQAGTIHGGVHIHGRRIEPARQVPPPPEHYTNHEKQLDAMTAALAHRDGQDGPKIVIVTGAPGSGRSTLCEACAQRHGDDYPDGHFMVRLGHRGRAVDAAGAEATRDALADLLAAVGYGPDAIPASVEARAGTWRTWTAGRRVLLVVDDASEVAQVRMLLPGKGRSAVLVVQSGKSLAGLRAKHAARSVRIDPFEDDAARKLLGRMAGADRFEAEPEATDRLVARCQGLAGALCVVGALLAELDRWPVARLADKLADEQRALAELSRDDDLSLTVVFDAAYERLTPLAQSCYRVLGAHPGDGDVAAETIAAVLLASVDDVSAACGDLARAMLVTETGEDRFLLSGLLRPHARLVADDESDRLRRAAVEYYRDRAVAASLAWMPTRGWFQELWPGLTGSGRFDRAAARAWLTAERANLRAAARAAGELGEPEWLGQFGVALWPLHDQAKHPHDLADVSGRAALAARGLAERSDGAARRHALLAAAVLGVQHGFAERQLDRVDQAADLFEAARLDAVASGSVAAEGTAVEALALARLDQDRLDEARELLRHNEKLAERLGVSRRIAMALFHRAKAEPPEVALPLLDRAGALLRAEESDETYTLVKVDLWRGTKLVEAGERLEEADGLLADAAETASRGGWHLEQAQCCEARADVALAGDDRACAVAHLRTAHEIYTARGFTARAADTAARLADLA